jgi:hypothetical protein
MSFGKKYLENLTGSEKAAYLFERRLLQYIQGLDGRFLRDDVGGLHVVIGAARIPLNYSRENHGLAKLMIQGCGISTINAGAQAAIQRLHVIASENASGLRLRRFSAVSEDEARVYVPVSGGKLLQITAGAVTQVANGSNTDSFWLEHPNSAPLEYAEGDPVERLGHFEKLLVDTQACVVPELRWFVAMAEGLFPFVRDLCPARLLMVHLGPTQSGKTTGAKRFVLLHALGDVKGDYSVAALGNMPDPGLLVMDNKEQANFTQALTDYCLFLATGAERGRSNADGENRTSGTRPAGVITTIEGVVKAELQKRCVNIEYAPRMPMLKRAPIEKEVNQRRHEISSALLLVLSRYLEIRAAEHDLPNPIPEFEEHFTEICILLKAYGDVAGKSREWANTLIDAWDRTLTSQELEDNDLEQPFLRVFREFKPSFHIERVTRKGREGTLYVTEAAQCLTLLQRLEIPDLILQKNASGLGRRLRSNKFKAFELLDADSAPEYECLKRTAEVRPIGFFVPSDERTERRIAA